MEKEKKKQKQKNYYAVVGIIEIGNRKFDRIIDKFPTFEQALNISIQKDLPIVKLPYNFNFPTQFNILEND